MNSFPPCHKWIVAWCAAWLLGVGDGTAQEATNGFALHDFLVAPVRIHLLTAAAEPAIHTTLTSNDVTRILGKVNRVWAQAGIAFHAESLHTEAAVDPVNYLQRAAENERATLLSLRPQASLTTNSFHVFYLKRIRPNGVYFNQQGIFVKDTASLRQVEGGLDEFIPRVTSHELGHALSLAHRQHVTNLLASGTSGAWLNAEEISATRAAAAKLPWIEPASAILKRAEQLHQAGRAAEALPLWRRLAAVPLDNDTTRRFRSLLAEAPAR